MKRLIPFAFLMCFILSNCGTSSSVIKDGNTAFQYKKYYLAAELLQAEFTKESNPILKFEIAKKIGDSYRAFSQSEKAEKWYKTALDIQPEINCKMAYAAMLKMNEKYTDAILVYDAIYKENRSREAYSQREGCKYALEWMQKNKHVKIENLKTINSSQTDFSPILYKDNQLIFSSSRADAKGNNNNEWTGEKNSDLWLIDKEGKLSKFSDSINSNAYEGTCTFSRDFKEIYFTRCGDRESQDNKCKIYYSKYENDEWSSPELIHLFPDSINVGQPSLSKDGKRLFFASDNPNGFGGKDLYYSVKKTGEWGTPFNVGRIVNTKGNEMFPFIDDENQLYFSSDFHQGMGGLDIFKSKLSDEGKIYGEVTNLQAPINSSYDDFGIIVTKYKSKNQNDLIKEEGFFTSARKGGWGKDDIYKYSKEHYNNFELIVKIVEKKYENPNDPNSKILGMQIVKDANTELENLTAKEFRKNAISNENGLCVFLLDKDADYKISANKKNYFSKITTTTTKGLQTIDSILVRIHVEIELEKIFPEKEILINNIYYDLDKATLRPESMNTLDTLITFFKENEHLTIEIGSHTDSRGSNEYNITLSQARAQSVVDYFITKGIDKSKIIAKGYGETKLTNGCSDGVECTEEEHQKNRRTTFKVVGEGVNLKSGE